MFLDRPPYVRFWRPFYKNFLVPKVYPRLARAGISIRAEAAHPQLERATPAAPPSASGDYVSWPELRVLLLAFLAQRPSDLASELRDVRAQQEQFAMRLQGVEVSLQAMAHGIERLIERLDRERMT